MLKTIVAVVVAAHGLGFSMWFLAAWTPGIKITETTPHWALSADVGITGALGRATGLLALLVAAAFLAVAWGVYTDAAWWSALAVAASVVSLIAIVLPWWSAVPPLSAVGAAVVDVGIVALALVPGWHDALASIRS